jgi:hypothetical protein
MEFVSPLLSFPRLALFVPVPTRSESTALSTRRVGRQASVNYVLLVYVPYQYGSFLRPSFLDTDNRGRQTDRQTERHTGHSCLNVNDCTDSYLRWVNNLRPTTRVNVSVTSNIIIRGHYLCSGSYEVVVIITFLKRLLAYDFNWKGMTSILIGRHTAWS